MQIKSFKKSDRLQSKLIWLDANFYFSFADKYNPERIRFGALLVVNDDIISANSGFGMHSHQNMEIITIAFSGILSHKDSLGNIGDITKNEVQVMTAGTGVTHSEYNNQNTLVNSFQIWIHPALNNLDPSYNQKSFANIETNNPKLLVSSDGRENSLIINQDAFISKLDLDSDSKVNFRLQDNFKFNKDIKVGIFITCLSGNFSVFVKKDNLEISDKFVLNEKDWLEIDDLDVIKDSLEINSLESKSEILIIQVPII